MIFTMSFLLLIFLFFLCLSFSSEVDVDEELDDDGFLDVFFSLSFLSFDGLSVFPCAFLIGLLLDLDLRLSDLDFLDLDFFLESDLRLDLDLRDSLYRSSCGLELDAGACLSISVLFVSVRSWDCFIESMSCSLCI